MWVWITQVCKLQEEFLNGGGSFQLGANSEQVRPGLSPRKYQAWLAKPERGPRAHSWAFCNVKRPIGASPNQASSCYYDLTIIIILEKSLVNSDTLCFTYLSIHLCVCWFLHLARVCFRLARLRSGHKEKGNKGQRWNETSMQPLPSPLRSLLPLFSSVLYTSCESQFSQHLGEFSFLIQNGIS